MSWNSRVSLLMILMLAGFCVHGCSYLRGTSSSEKMYSQEYTRSNDITKVKDTSKQESGSPTFTYKTYKTISSESKQYGMLTIEKNLPEEVQVNLPFDYSIKITNATDVKLNNVVVTENFSHKYKVQNSIPKMQSDSRDDIAKWILGDLEAYGSRLIRIIGVPMDTGELPFCTDVTYDLPPLCLFTSVVQPKLTVTKQAPSEVMFCDTIPVTLVVDNSGSGIARNVKVSDSLPAGLKTLTGDKKVFREIGDLGPGESREIFLDLKANRTGKYTNTATVVADGGLSAKSNTTTTVVKQPILSIEKTGPKVKYLGHNITYEIMVKNEGDGSSDSTVIEDAIPANTSFLNASGGGIFSDNSVIWNLGTLIPNDYRKVSVTVRANEMGKVVNRATAKAVCAAAVSSSAVTEVLGIPAILLEVVDVMDPILIGDTVTYVITVTNQGSETSKNIHITCYLEDEMEYVSSSGPTYGTLVDSKTYDFAPLARLAPKAKASWKVEIKAIGEGDVRFKVSMKDDRLNRPVEETEDKYFY